MYRHLCQAREIEKAISSLSLEVPLPSNLPPLNPKNRQVRKTEIGLLLTFETVAVALPPRSCDGRKLPSRCTRNNLQLVIHIPHSHQAPLQCRHLFLLNQLDLAHTICDKTRGEDMQIYQGIILETSNPHSVRMPTKPSPTRPSLYTGRQHLPTLRRQDC